MLKHLDNGFLLVKEDSNWVSPLAVLYFEYYDDLAQTQDVINRESDKLQCVVSTAPLQTNTQIVHFGMSQQPSLWDYADGIDTMEFLSNLYTFDS